MTSNTTQLTIYEKEDPLERLSLTQIKIHVVVPQLLRFFVRVREPVTGIFIRISLIIPYHPTPRQVDQVETVLELEPIDRLKFR